MINQIVSKEAEEQVVRITKLLKENMDAIKAHESLLRSSTTGAQVRENADKLTKANEDFSKTEKEIIALVEKRNNLLSEQAKQVAELKAQNKQLLESQTKLAAVNESERNSLERAQKLILLYTDQKKKLNLATAEGVRMNENYNKAIEKANAFIIKNADVETKRAKNVGNYASSLAPLFNNLASSIRQAEISVKDYTKAEGAQGPNTQKAIQDLKALQNVFANVSTQAAIAGQTQEGFIAATKSSLTSLQTAGMTNTTIYADLTNGLNNSITPTTKAAGGFNALGNSIQQITREAPAFVNSVQTGFMAISNNLPALFDAIGSIRAQNAAAKEEAMAAATAQGFLAKEQALAGGASEEAADKIKEQATAMALSSAEGVKGKGVLKQLASSFFSLSTLISLGITLLTVYGKDIWEFIKATVKGTDALDEFAEKQRLVNEAYKDNAVKDAVKNVIELGLNIKLAKNNMADKEAVVDQYNQTIGKTAGLVETLDEAEKGLTRNGDAYIKMTLFKAAANLAMEESAKKVLEAEQTRQKSLEDFAKFGDNTLLGTTDQGDTYENKQRMREANEKARFEARKKRQADEIKASEDAVLAQNKLAEALNKKAADQAKLMGGLLYGDKGKAAKEQEKIEKQEEAARKKKEREQEKANKKELKDAEQLAKDKEEAAKKVFDSNYELMKTDAANSAETSKNIMDNEELTLNERLKASIEFYANKQNLLDIEQTKEVYEAQGNRDAIQAINVKYEKEREKLLKEHYGIRAVIIKSANDHELELALKALDKEKEKYDQYSLEALRDLDQQYIDGLISTEDYHKQREYIAANSLQNSLLAQLDYGEKQLAILKAQGVNVVEFEKRLATLRQQIASGGAANKEDATKKAEITAEEIKGIWMNNANATTSLLNDIADAFNAAEERKFNKRIKAIDDEEKRRLDSLGRLTLSEKERDERREKIEREAEYRRQKADRDKITSMRKIAAFQKAIDIAQIITSTAVAIVGFLAKPGGYPGLALSIGAGITGAAQVAKAVATPLPQYAKGRLGGKAEAAWVGEDGPEVIEQPGQKPFVVDKPTVMWLEQGANVLPTNKALLDSLFRPTMAVLANSGNKVTSDSYGKAMIEAYERGADKIEKAVRNSQSNVSIYGDIGKIIYKQKQHR